MSDPRGIKEFYALGLFWKFYSDGTNMVYQTSTDELNWSSPETVRTPDMPRAHPSKLPRTSERGG